MRFSLRTPTIEFVTHKQHWGVIPEPYPAVRFLPTWYKKLPHRTSKLDSTVKRCAPFLDSMGAGYILPLAADVQLTMKDGGENVKTDSDFYDKIIGLHGKQQLGSEHPVAPGPVLKFSNFWAFKVPKGWSVLCVPPLNRPNETFECFSGIVECDQYWNYVNFPFFMKDPSFKGIIPQGTPIIQLIPFKRSALKTKMKCSVMSALDEERMKRTSRQLAAHKSHYRDCLWKRGRSA